MTASVSGHSSAGAVGVPSALPATGDGATVAAIRAEWTKVRTLRSMVAVLVGTFVASVGLAVLSGASVSRALRADNGMVRADFNPVDSGFNIVWYTQLGMVAFGVLLMSGEFGSGMIRVSLAAVPQRWRLYAAKAGMCTAVVLPLAAVTVVLSFLLDQAALGEYGAGAEDAGVMRGMALGTVYLTLIALLSFGVATAVRSTAVALGAMYVFLFAVSPISQAVPGLKEAARYLPDKAGIQALKVGADADPALGPWGGILIVVGWTVLALVVGWLSFRKREV
ncbi:ABC transporter permease [Streptomyces albus]